MGGRALGSGYMSEQTGLNVPFFTTVAALFSFFLFRRMGLGGGAQLGGLGPAIEQALGGNLSRSSGSNI